MKKFAVIAGAVAALGAVGWSLYLNGKLDFLLRLRRITVEVNGVAVDGDVYGHRFVSVVTRRDPGKQHSYLLSSAGDIDPAGNLGSVTDCHDWVAPRLPLLIQTRSYPPCLVRPDEAKRRWIWTLTPYPHGVKFVTPEHETIVIREALP